MLNVCVAHPSGVVVPRVFRLAVEKRRYRELNFPSRGPKPVLPS
jgi:hypothetical protein